MQQQQEAIGPTPAPDEPQVPRGPFPWGRMIVMLCIAVVLIGLSLAIWIAGGPMLNWGAVAPLVLALILALIPFAQWLFPLNPVAWRPQESPEPTPIGAAPVTGDLFHFETRLPTPTEFFGREYERDTLLTRISSRSSTAIVGDYRIGKSWLMQYLLLIIPRHPQLGPRVHIGRMSATHPQNQSLPGFVKHALEVLEAPDYPANGHETPLELLSIAARSLKKLGIIPVLCIDEFAGLLGKPGFDRDFITGLRAIAEDDGLVLITASRHPLPGIIQHLSGDTSPLFNIMQELTLRPFNAQEAHFFVEQKSRLAGFNQEEQRFFLACAAMPQPDGAQGWPPLRLQLVGQMLRTDKEQKALHLKDPMYPQAFKQRVERAYQAVVSEP